MKYENKKEDIIKKEDIEIYLSLINDKLKELNQHGEILMAGGAVLALIHNARDSTHDIDAIFEPKNEMQMIIKSIANENNLKSDWLNDGCKGFLNSNMTHSVIKEYSNLTVSAIDPAPLLAMKLTSARMAGHDKNDSIILMKSLNIQHENECFDIIEKYTHKDRQTPLTSFFTVNAFNEYKEQYLINTIDKNKSIKQTFNEKLLSAKKEVEQRNTLIKPPKDVDKES